MSPACRLESAESSSYVFVGVYGRVVGGVGVPSGACVTSHHTLYVYGFEQCIIVYFSSSRNFGGPSLVFAIRAASLLVIRPSSFKSPACTLKDLTALDSERLTLPSLFLSAFMDGVLGIFGAGVRWRCRCCASVERFRGAGAGRTNASFRARFEMMQIFVDRGSRRPRGLTSNWSETQNGQSSLSKTPF